MTSKSRLWYLWRQWWWRLNEGGGEDGGDTSGGDSRSAIGAGPAGTPAFLIPDVRSSIIMMMTISKEIFFLSAKNHITFHSE
jgi:hypothetical protein